MRPALLPALALLVAACLKPPAPPPVPPTLAAALAEVDGAVQHGGDVGGPSEKLARELVDHAQRPMPPMMAADLHALGREVAVFGATNDDPMHLKPPPVGAWTELKSRIDRVLAGQNPTEGPRYALDMPEPVRAGMQRVDALLAQGDADRAASAIGALQGPLAEWMTRLPGMRAVRLNEVIERDLVAYSMVATKGLDLARVRADWGRIRGRIEGRGE